MRFTAVLSRQNLVEKIVQRYAVDLPQPGYKVKQGDFVSIQPEHVMTHDNTGAVISKFNSIGASKFKNPRQPVFTLDHDIQNKSEKNITKYRNIETFAQQYGIDFYPAGRGIGHQIMIEEGYAFPYTLTVASDSHSNMYGGIGSLGTPIVRTDAAAIWATGRTWWQIPPVARVELTGRLPAGSSGKDIIVTLCGLFNQDQVLNHAVEFAGDGVENLRIDDRLSIANMTTEWGALAGLFPVDKVTLSWLKLRSERFNQHHPRINNDRLEQLSSTLLQSDPNAFYAKTLKLDLSTVVPSVSGPNSVKMSTSVYKLEEGNIKINKAYLLSCTNSRLSDIAAAAKICKTHGKAVAQGVEFYVAAASSEVQKDAESLGYWKTLLDAGAKPLPAGCGPCIGLGTGLLKDGEVGISSTNRNYKGRMGSPLAQAYLSSPEVVAASAIAGRICSPLSLSSKSFVASLHSPPSLKSSIVVHTALPTSASSETPLSSNETTATSTVPGFDPIIKGELVFCDADNLNTDGIYPGKYTYIDDLPPSKMAQVVMENYDKDFSKIAKPSDILVSGFNFGTGSSREQAATSILYAGIKLIIAGSFSETYKRNAMNNGLLVLEAPELVQSLRQHVMSPASSPLPELTRRTGWKVEIDLINGIMSIHGSKQRFSLPGVGRAAQELVAEGGLEKWTQNRM